MVPRKPRAASSKSRVSENGSAFRVAACCAMTGAEASFGVSFGASLVPVWVMLLSSLASQRILFLCPQAGRGRRTEPSLLHLARIHLDRRIQQLGRERGFHSERLLHAEIDMHQLVVLFHPFGV